MLDKHKIIALLTDFGLKESSVAAMKGTILSICPEAQIIDISHEIPLFNVRYGAFVLASAAPYFPKGTIFVGVVDPGVGTERRGIVVETENYLAVGPDNGLFSLLMDRERVRSVYEIRNEDLMLEKKTHTFHGLTIFSPVAAHLANGVEPRMVGPKINNYIRWSIPKTMVKEGVIWGEIIHIDQFGNGITNITENDLKKIGVTYGSNIKIRIDSKRINSPFQKAYGYTKIGSYVCVIGSYDFLEISINQGNAAKKLGIKVGSKVKVERLIKIR
ncbi:MAG: S-adenosyl-l-methionine hydroxide adenosyltransferase family protein [Candidatus Freyarchaeota archaeon]|nr:S-adenosyl-l-methionine hydroxide adenosyltransferase family protein [Candidatus Jordarchaeia archaeon]